MDATLDHMGYRGEDVPTTHGDWGRQQPWQPSPGRTPANPGAWDDGSQGYRGEGGYRTDDSGYGYGPDDGYSGQGQSEYGSHDGQYGRQPYGGYRPAQGQGGYDGQSRHQRGDYEYSQPDDYGQRGPAEYGAGDYDSGDYDSGDYPVSPANGDFAPRYGNGSYPGPPNGSGGYPALPSGPGGYPTADAGNDWYGGQPAAARGASFADTGAYALNGRVIDEYGTGPRAAMRDPVRGYPPGRGWQGSGPLPVPARPALPAPPRSGSQPVAETRQQERLDEPPPRPGRAASGGFRSAPSRDFPRAASGSFPSAAAPGAFEGLGAAQDPYADRADGTDGTQAVWGGGRGSGKARGRRPARGTLGGKRLLIAALGVVAFGIAAAAAYVFLLKPSSPSGNSTATGPLPTSSAQSSQQACVKQLGTYCHIETATDDPKPLTVAELYPPAFTNEQDKTSASLVSTKLDTKCSNAVIGQDLIKALQTYKCTQVVRASYVSSDGKIMGTIGVVNLATTNDAHYAGKVISKNDFIAPLMSKTGVASKLGNGTGLVEADFKGHYLILTWSEYVNGTVPSTAAQDTPLKQFNSDLVTDTANIALTQRMVTGAPGSPGASS